MSLKAKDLTYNKEQPAFLQRLRAQHGGDRSNVQFARPKKDRLKTGDADEDEPTIVDEQGETIAKAEWEERQKTEYGGADVAGKLDSGNVNGKAKISEALDVAGSAREKQHVAGIGAGKKRKAAKAVADENEGLKTGNLEAATGDVEGSTTKLGETHPEPVPKTKKKGKKIKLSFDEPD